MEKVLKPYTIIPQELYIQRDADRQLKRIIDDMGRPGYVLVSRQMGKTNLLLNAKRKFETPADVFVYIDLSNPFETAKSCFENIIDIALDTNYDKFKSASELIRQRRKEFIDTPAHKQHLNELRILLKAITGKLVIILDEIDALTKTDYSDQIFAQIRSIYFSRVNYKELSNLTYILSGVIEPNEIIKDPKISPFNIGQKIFLNDFDREEFKQFIQASKIVLPPIAEERIYFWTNGNPRMTWDVCSEVENINHSGINLKTIDEIISRMYLTAYDKPPIDHIRELVAKDREIRDAIIELVYNKGREISDKVKNKLYLAGIANYQENTIEIKNEVIRQALNLDWIRSLEEADKGLIRIATELFEKEKFQDSLLAFEKFLLENTFSEEESSLYYYYMGIAAYRSSLFEKASMYLDRAYFDSEEEGKLFYKLLHIKALVYYYRGLMDESLDCLKQIIEAKRNDETYLRALLNYGSFSLNSSKASHKTESVKIFEGIIREDGINKDKIKDEFLDELKSISHYNLAQVNLSNHDVDAAIKNYQHAIDYSKGKKPAIVIALLKIIKTDEEKHVILNQLIDLIIAGKIKPIENDPERPIDFTFDELREVAIAGYLNSNENLFKKVVPALSLLAEQSIAKHLQDLAVYSMSKNSDWESANKLLLGIYKNFNDPDYRVDDETKYKTLKYLAYLNPPKENISFSLQYVSTFAKIHHDIIDYVDMEIFANTVFALSEKKKYQEALNYLALIDSVRMSVPESIQINYLVLYHLELNIYAITNNRPKALQKAAQILELANNEKIKVQTSNLLGDTGLEIIKQNAESIINPRAKKQSPIIKARTYGRNEIVKVRYTDGTIIETKFKRVEDDINKKECYILN